MIYKLFYFQHVRESSSRGTHPCLPPSPCPARPATHSAPSSAASQTSRTIQTATVANQHQAQGHLLPAPVLIATPIRTALRYEIVLKVMMPRDD